MIIQETFFSVIIPCYNSQKHIEKALCSLENQRFKYFEVILVDDASTDDTYSFLLGYQSASHLSIQLLQNEINSGPGYSRNYGINNANGKYITFLDSDDWYEPELLSTVYAIIVSENSELVFYNFYRAYSEYTKKPMLWTKILSDTKDRATILALCFNSLCTLCVKRENFQSIKIPDIYNMEDAVTVPLLVCNAVGISFLSAPLYNYFYRPNSLSTKRNRDIINSSLIAYTFLKNNIPEMYAEATEYRGILLMIYGCIYKSLEAGIESSEISQLIDTFIKDYPDFYKNQYLRFLPARKRIFIKLARYKYYFLLKIYVRIQFFLLNNQVLVK